jgi:predicted deacylase
MSENPAFELPRPELGHWRAGNTGLEGVWRFDSGRPGRAVMVSALVHGNELCGAWAVLGALEAGLRPVAGSLTLAFCNLAAFDRFDPAEPHKSRFVDEDFNRVWGPGLAAAEPGTQEKRRAQALRPVVESADWLLDLHSMHDPGMPLMLSGLMPRSIALARSLGAPAHVVADAGHAQGRRMRDHGRFADPEAEAACALLIECGAHGELASRDVAFDSVSRFLAASGVMAESALPPEWRLPTPAAQQLLEVTEAIAARGLDVRFAQAWRNGDTLAEAGTVLGWNEGEPFVTPYPDCTLVMPSLRQLQPGVTVMRLARRAG